jgi:hypothetical protein
MIFAACTRWRIAVKQLVPTVSNCQHYMQDMQTLYWCRAHTFLALRSISCPAGK